MEVVVMFPDPACSLVMIECCHAARNFVKQKILQAGNK
jgi:hypothetical protein